MSVIFCIELNLNCNLKSISSNSLDEKFYYSNFKYLNIVSKLYTDSLLKLNLS